jgi:hypothetical protein
MTERNEPSVPPACKPQDHTQGETVSRRSRYFPEPQRHDPPGEDRPFIRAGSFAAAMAKPPASLRLGAAIRGLRMRGSGLEAK